MLEPNINTRSTELVLVVDDLRFNRDMIGAFLERMGLDVIYAENGREAIDKFILHHPSLIIMDIYMPEMNGIEATQQIKKLLGSMVGEHFVPIIVVSSADEGDVVTQVVHAGADDFIQRPFSSELLQAKIVAMRRISKIYHQLSEITNLRQREEEIAEQLFSNAIESQNQVPPFVKLIKTSADIFSGDIILSARRPDGGFNILLGDFTGHGLTSTIGALPLAETFSTMTVKGFEAAEILAQINRKLNRLLPKGMFLATGFISLSSTAHTISIWNGGLPELIIRRTDGQLTFISSSHFPLGIVPEVRNLQFQVHTLAADDRVFMFSDGVSEALNGTGERFGDDRIQDLLITGEEPYLTDLISRELDKFCGKTPKADDVSLVEILGQALYREKEQSVKSLVSDKPERSLIETDSTTSDRWNICLELNGETLRRINPVAQILSRLQESEGEGEHWHDVFSILTELYVNALDHGILGIDSSIKDSSDGFARYFDVREERLAELTTGTVNIDVGHCRTEEGGIVDILIKDSGKGFSYQDWFTDHETGIEPSVNLCGRGILLVKQLADDLRYSEGGAQVKAVYSYSNGR